MIIYSTWPAERLLRPELKPSASLITTTTTYPSCPLLALGSWLLALGLIGFRVLGSWQLAVGTSPFHQLIIDR
jgi:hypothetical protein